jgi:hypothetical protein
MDASVDMEGSLGAALLGYVTVGVRLGLASTARGAVRKKAGPAWVRPETRVTQ